MADKEIKIKESDLNSLIERLEKLENQGSNEVKQPKERKRNGTLLEKVKVKLFKDGDKYKDDVFVSINGKAMQIKRGIEVEIPKAYAMLLDQSQIQSIRAAELIDNEQKKFASQNV